MLIHYPYVATKSITCGFEDMRLYKTWVETYEKNEEIHAEGVETRREAEGDYDGMGSTPIPPGDSQAVPKAKPKPKPKSSAPKVKTDEQLARAAPKC